MTPIHLDFCSRFPTRVVGSGAAGGQLPPNLGSGQLGVGPAHQREARCILAYYSARLGRPSSKQAVCMLAAHTCRRCAADAVGGKSRAQVVPAASFHQGAACPWTHGGDAGHTLVKTMFVFANTALLPAGRRWQVVASLSASCPLADCPAGGDAPHPFIRATGACPRAAVNLNSTAAWRNCTTATRRAGRSPAAAAAKCQGW